MPFTPTGTWYDEPAPKGPPKSSGSVLPTQPMTPAAGSVDYSRTSGQVLGAWNQVGGVYEGPDAYKSFSDQVKGYIAGGAGTLGAPPSGPGGSSGGYGYGGGGGGGGGAAAPMMSQAQWDAMLGVLGTPSPDLQLKGANLPNFRGRPIRKFQGRMYNQMQNRLNQAVRGDRQSVINQMNQLRGQLQADYSNPYETAQYARNPQAQPQMQQVMAQAGANPVANEYAESVNAENAYGQNSDAAFANLLNVLGASNQAEQTSRLGQVGMDRAEALRQIEAQSLGLGTGIDLSRGKAKEAWQVRADERRYQNSLTRQQWNREERMRNQDLRNLERQTEYTTGVETQNSRIQALLDMIGASTGATIDYGGVEDIIRQLGGAATPTTARAARGRGVRQRNTPSKARPGKWRDVTTKGGGGRKFPSGRSKGGGGRNGGKG